MRSPASKGATPWQVILIVASPIVERKRLPSRPATVAKGKGKWKGKWRKMVTFYPTFRTTPGAFPGNYRRGVKPSRQPVRGPIDAQQLEHLRDDLGQLVVERP